MFRVLKKGGHHWNPDEVHAWALTNGWDNRGAGDLRKYAAGIAEGHSFRTSGYGLNAAALSRWREEAAQG